MRYAKRVAALGAITSLVLVACGSDDGGGSADTTAAPAGTEAPAETGAPGDTTAGTTGGAAAEGLVNGEIPCDQQHEGKTVSVLSPVRNSENDPDAIQLFTDFWAPLVGVHRRHDRLPGHGPVRGPGSGVAPGRQPA